MLQYCETKKISTEKRKPPSLSLTSFDIRNWWNTKGFRYELVRHCETLKIRQKTVIRDTAPPPVSSINFFVPGNFLKHSTEGFPRQNFVTERQKAFDGNSWNSPLIHEHFRCRKFCETQHSRRVGLRKNSVLWDKKNSTEKRQLPFLSLTIFEIRSWWSTKLFPYEFFRRCETKKIPKENLDLPHPLIHQLLRYRKFFKTQRRCVSLRKIPAPWDKKIRRKNVNNTFLSTNISRYPKLMKH